MKLTENSSNWQETQDSFAESSGVAVVLVDENSTEIHASNNNSICRHLYNSKEFAPRCAEFCGKAFRTAHETGKTVYVKCHADLNFLTVPLSTDNRKFAAIIGKAFLKSEDFRRATERAASGDWAQMSGESFFENVLLSGTLEELERAAKKFEKLFGKESRKLAAFCAPQNGKAKHLSATVGSPGETKKGGTPEERKNGKKETGFSQPGLNSESAEEQETKSPDQINYDLWRSRFGALLESDYKSACALILQFVAERFGYEDSAWLERRGDDLEPVTAHGKFEDAEIKIRLSASDELLFEVLRREKGLEMRERRDENIVDPQTIWLFPVAVGGVIRGALFIANGSATEEIRRKLARFCRRISPQIEILRLRYELERQKTLSEAVKKFNENLDKIEPENLWEYFADFCSELMHSERSSILFYDEEAQKFTVKAALGRRAAVIRSENETLGKRVAEGVFESGSPLVVRDLTAAGIEPAPAEWKYKTSSFISYPIVIDDRKIGVLNITDRTGGDRFDDFDLEILNSIAPHFAVAYDRAALKHKAGEFEQLSVTDALTGLSNRRYLEARLEEEIKRSHRTGAPMSFLMIDVDEFKSYNDTFGHTEGDRALQIVARCLREVLRGADVAARYGGEEFSILLPQTTLSEAYLIAERVRQKIEQTPFPKRKVTVSIGVASCPPKCTLNDLISAADRALYEAKHGGRNLVRIYNREKYGTQTAGGDGEK